MKGVGCRTADWIDGRKRNDLKEKRIKFSGERERIVVGIKLGSIDALFMHPTLRVRNSSYLVINL